MEVYQAVEETLRFLFETKFTSLVQELIVQGLFELATTGNSRNVRDCGLGVNFHCTVF